jgi:nucleotide-binding universal stress UspA family protein
MTAMAPKLFSRILVPHDFSDASGHALKQAVALAATHHGTITVQHVIEPYVLSTEIPLGLAADMLPDAASFVPLQRRALETLVRKAVGSTGVKFTIRVDVGNPVQSIVDAARGASAIVIATHGRTGVTHFLLGSVAERVIRHASVPVLTIRVPQAKKRRG